jgi:hypothetical protein
LITLYGICASNGQELTVKIFLKLVPLKVYEKGRHHTTIVSLIQLKTFRAIMAVY